MRERKRKQALAGKLKTGAGNWPSPSECGAFISHGAAAGRDLTRESVLAWAGSNSTLLRYLYPATEPSSVREGWRPLTRGCRVVPSGCWCFHVAGSMVKADNPRGLRQCAPKDRTLDCSDPSQGFFAQARRNCSCFAQRPAASPCLFGDMRPAKLLAIIAACRAAGVTHIIEQGRYGGLSAWMYAHHGFRVTSVELLPLAEVTSALGALAPAVRQVDGDGRAEVLRLVGAAAAGERLAVIFDGEKRQTAYATFRRVKQRIALGVFDDTNLDDGAFPRELREAGEEAWHTWDCAFMRRHGDAAPLGTVDALLRGAATTLVRRAADGGAMLRRRRVVDEKGRLIFHGGMEDLSRFHSTLVRGGLPWA